MHICESHRNETGKISALKEIMVQFIINYLHLFYFILIFS